MTDTFKKVSEIFQRCLDEDTYVLDDRPGIAFSEYFGERVAGALEEAGWVIVAKPTGDRVTAALEAFTHAVWHRQPQLYAWEFPAQPMAAALAAADAADGRVTVDPDDPEMAELIGHAIAAPSAFVERGVDTLPTWQRRAVLAALRDGGRSDG